VSRLSAAFVGASRPASLARVCLQSECNQSMRQGMLMRGRCKKRAVHTHVYCISTNSKAPECERKKHKTHDSRSNKTHDSRNQILAACCTDERRHSELIGKQSFTSLLLRPLPRYCCRSSISMAAATSHLRICNKRQPCLDTASPRLKLLTTLEAAHHA
jgi:hypothetical protein